MSEQINTNWDYDNASTNMETVTPPKSNQKEKRIHFFEDRFRNEWSQSSSTMASATYDLCKDSMTIDNLSLSYSKEFSLEWLANKCWNIGRIDSIQDYFNLIDGTIEEDCQSINLTFNTLKEFNEKLASFSKSEKGITNQILESSREEKISEKSLVNQVEFSKIISINALILSMEQNNRICMLYYLLKVSSRDNDFEDFEIISEFLANLTESRRFNDAFISVLEELSLFRTDFKESEDSGELWELGYLFSILQTSFFDEDVKKWGKQYYLRFLVNLFHKSRLCYSEIFLSNQNLVSHQLMMSVNWKEISLKLTDHSDIKKNQEIDVNFESNQTKLNLVKVINHTNFGEVIFSLAKWYENSEDFDNMIESENLVTLLAKILVAKNHDSQSLFQVNEIEVKLFLTKIYELVHQRLQQFDEIFRNLKFRADKYLDTTLGFTIKNEDSVDFNSTFSRHAMIMTEEGEEIWNFEEVSPDSKVRKTITQIDNISVTDSNAFSAYHKGSMARHKRSTLIENDKDSKRERHKNIFLGPFVGLKRLWCLK